LEILYVPQGVTYVRFAPFKGTSVAVLKPNRIIRKCTDANYSSFHLRVFLGLPQHSTMLSDLFDAPTTYRVS
jgi:hypothetical protein